MDETSAQRSGWARAIVSIVLCLALLGGAVAAVYAIYETQPKARREGATRKSAALVETILVKRGDYRPEIVVLGRVEPAKEINLSPRVGGEVTLLHPQLVPGGLVKEGDPLLEIDSEDFEQREIMRIADRDQVRSRLKIEEGNQRLAKQEFAAFGESMEKVDRELVLREPQIASLRAELNAAEAALQMARIDVARTCIAAPFDAQILEKSVDVGSQVALRDNLARLVGTREYWVIATVPLRQLPWLTFATDDAPGGAATIHHTAAWPEGATRAGHVVRLIGTLDEQTRLARVLITVADPLALKTDGPRMILDAIVEVRIVGRPIADAIRIKRTHLRKNDTVWVLNDGKLDIREVTVAFRDAEHAYITKGLDAGEEVVTSTLATVSPGIPLRRESTQPAEADANE